MIDLLGMRSAIFLFFLFVSLFFWLNEQKKITIKIASEPADLSETRHPPPSHPPTTSRDGGDDGKKVDEKEDDEK